MKPMRKAKYRPRIKEVLARQWLGHGETPCTEVRPLTFWERFFAPKFGLVSLDDMGMVVVGGTKQQIAPGFWIVYDEDSVLVFSNKNFTELYTPTSLDPTLQDLVDELNQLKGTYSIGSVNHDLIDNTIKGLYTQAEIISRCYQEKYAYDTRNMPRRPA